MSSKSRNIYLSFLLALIFFWYSFLCFRQRKSNPVCEDVHISRRQDVLEKEVFSNISSDIDEGTESDTIEQRNNILEEHCYSQNLFEGQSPSFFMIIAVLIKTIHVMTLSTKSLSKRQRKKSTQISLKKISIHFSVHDQLITML